MPHGLENLGRPHGWGFGVKNSARPASPVRLVSQILLRLLFDEFIHYTGKGNGNPLQCSCLGNPMDREEPGGLQSTGLLESDMTEWLNNKSSNSLFTCEILGEGWSLLLLMCISNRLKDHNNDEGNSYQCPTARETPFSES